MTQFAVETNNAPWATPSTLFPPVPIIKVIVAEVPFVIDAEQKTNSLLKSLPCKALQLVGTAR